MQIELDIAYDYYDTAEYNHDLAAFVIGDRLVVLEGPGGGNPVVEFRGTEQNLRAFLAHWEFDEDDIEYFLFGE